MSKGEWDRKGRVGREKERGIEKFVVFTHRTSIGRWSYSECLLIMTLEKTQKLIKMFALSGGAWADRETFSSTLL